MKILVVANVNSTHTQKWCLALAGAGCQVALFSIDAAGPDTDWHLALSHRFVSPYPRKKLHRYFLLYARLRDLMRRFGPDVLHSHFLTNYSLLANMTGFRNHVATAWGSDVFMYARRNFFTASLVRYNMRSARRLVSTSFAMAGEMKRYTSRHVEVIPFGIDLGKFTPSPASEPVIRIACFKHLERIYAPDVLLSAFAILCGRLPGKPLRLLLAGSGSMRDSLREQAEKAGIADKVDFTGWVPPAEVPALLQKSSLCVYLSREESFGVSLLEAMACRKPLVVTPTVGFREVAEKDNAALFCRFDDPSDAAEKMFTLITDPGLCDTIASNGYRTVTEKYDLRENINRQIALYQEMLGLSQKDRV